MRRWITYPPFALICCLALASPAPASASALEQQIQNDGTDGLGGAVALDGDTLVVGAASNGPGAVFVYRRVGDTWVQTAKLTASDGASGDRLGSSVAVDGDTIVAGASAHRVGDNPAQGVVYTFARTGAAARTETGELIASDGAASDRLGSSVAIDGGTIVAGAPFATIGDGVPFLPVGDGVPSADVGGNAAQGAAYTFSRRGAAKRRETAKLTSTAGEASDRFSNAVDIDGDTIASPAGGTAHSVRFRVRRAT